MFARVEHSGKCDYLQIVENFRGAQEHKQRVVATAGRLDVLQDWGQLDGRTRSAFTRRIGISLTYKR